MLIEPRVGYSPLFFVQTGPSSTLLTDPSGRLGEAFERDRLAQLRALSVRIARGEAVSTELFSHEASGVILLGTNSPNLPLEHLAEACNALKTHDLVVGPAWDGGYYLLGMSKFHPELLTDNLSKTLRAATRLSLQSHILPAWYRVSGPTELRRLAEDLRDTPPERPGYPHATAALLATLFPVPPRAQRNERWKTLASRRAWQTPWLRAEENLVALDDEKLTLYGVVTCARAVGVVPVCADGRVLLVRQFRYVARRETWELPTGGAKEDEDLEAAARRELREETGWTARRLRRLSTFHTSKSVMDEVAHLYLGEDLEPAHAPADETEDLRVEAFSLERCMDLVLSGEIVDAMSIIGLMLVERERALRP